MAEKEESVITPAAQPVAQPNFEPAIRASKDTTKSNYYGRMDNAAQRQPASAAPVVTREQSIQNTPDGGNKQVIKTTAPASGQGTYWSPTRGLQNESERPKPQGIVGYFNSIKAPPAKMEGGAFGGPFETAEGAGAAASLSGITSVVEPALKSALTVPGPGAPPMNQPGTPYSGAPYGAQVNEARLAGGALTKTAEEAKSGIVPNAGLSRFGITQQNMSGGGTQYTLPGGQGVMTVAPQAPGTYNDEAARAGVFNTADQTRQGIMQGLETQYANQKMLDQEAFQGASSDEAMKELEMQKAAGIVPLSGMAEYERNAQRMTERAKYGETGAAKMEAERLAAGKEAYNKYQENKGIVATAAGKNATEAAKMGLEYQKFGLEQQKAAGEERKRQTDINKMVYDMGMGAQMEQAKAQAKNDLERYQIGLNFQTEAIKQTYGAPMKALQDKIALGSATDEDIAQLGKLDQSMKLAYAMAEITDAPDGKEVIFPSPEGPVKLIRRDKKWNRA